MGDANEVKRDECGDGEETTREHKREKNEQETRSVALKAAPRVQSTIALHLLSTSMMIHNRSTIRVVMVPRIFMNTLETIIFIRRRF